MRAQPQNTARAHIVHRDTERTSTSAHMHTACYCILHMHMHAGDTAFAFATLLVKASLHPSRSTAGLHCPGGVCCTCIYAHARTGSVYLYFKYLAFAGSGTLLYRRLQVLRSRDCPTPPKSCPLPTGRQPVPPIQNAAAVEKDKIKWIKKIEKKVQGKFLCRLHLL